MVLGLWLGLELEGENIIPPLPKATFSELHLNFAKCCTKDNITTRNILIIIIPHRNPNSPD